MPEKQPIKESKEIIIQIGENFIIISTTKLPALSIKKVSLEVKEKGKKPEKLLTAEIRINIPWLLELKNKIGEESFIDLITLSLNEIKLDIQRDLIQTIENTETLVEKLPKPLEKSLIYNLSELKELLDSIINEALQSDLNEEAKNRLNLLKQQLEKESKIEVSSQDMENIKRIIDIFKIVLELGNLNRISSPKDASQIIELITQERIFNIQFLLNIIENLKQGKTQDALKLFITGLVKAPLNKKIIFSKEIFETYIKPINAALAGYLVIKLSSSGPVLDNLLKILEKWMKKE